MTNRAAINLKSLENPPGSILIWLFVFVELIAFGLGFLALAYFRGHSPQIFNQEQQVLESNQGLILTFLLLISGALLAESVHSYFHGEQKKSIWLHRLSILGGLAFLVIKFTDYSHKIELGHVLGKNTFWDYYWLLTGFHSIHVVVGILLLIFVNVAMSRNSLTDEDFAIRGSALFWHMCDLAWLFIFPLFYLGKS